MSEFSSWVKASGEVLDALEALTKNPDRKSAIALILANRSYIAFALGHYTGSIPGGPQTTNVQAQPHE
jgi:hypothetical protein